MTRASQSPVRRIVTTESGELVVEIFDRFLTLRPYRSRKGGAAQVDVAWGAVYLRALLTRPERATRKRRVSRGRKIDR